MTRQNENLLNSQEAADYLGFSLSHRVPLCRQRIHMGNPCKFRFLRAGIQNLPVDSVTDANTPFTFATETDAVFGSIHEAALYDYPEMTLLRTEGAPLKPTLPRSPMV